MNGFQLKFFHEKVDPLSTNKVVLEKEKKEKEAATVLRVKTYKRNINVQTVSRYNRLPMNGRIFNSMQLLVVEEERLMRASICPHKVVRVRARTI